MLSKEDKEILTLQDERTLGENDKLLEYLESADNKIKLRALYALANISDTASVYKTSPFLQELYEDKQAALLNEYAFLLDRQSVNRAGKNYPY